MLPTTSPSATMVRRIAAGSARSFASCATKASQSREGNAAITAATGSR
jgi:hypothetical protein